MLLFRGSRDPVYVSVELLKSARGAAYRFPSDQTIPLPWMRIDRALTSLPARPFR